jgi:RHS repeat-associated protein
VEHEFHHGYTGHEHLDQFELIHMNGRLYDPNAGRFMSADPFVKFLSSSQGFNRYSYTDNNPLSRVDLNGYGWFSKVKKKLSKTWKKYKKQIITIAVVALAAYTGGAAYSAFMASQAGSAMAIAGYSGSTIMAAAGAVGGAAAGAVVGAASGYAATGTLKGALTGAAVGGIAGGIGGAASGYFGNGMTGRMLSGGLNGATQTGTVEGFARGMLSGAIPTDLGMNNAYMNDPYANAAINIGRDGIRGYIIDGEEGARRSIKGGLTNNAIGHLHGYVMQQGWSAPTFETGTGTWRYDVTSVFGSAMTPAITFGNVVSYNTGNYSTSYLNSIQPHELEHAHEQSALGVAYLPTHAASQWTGSYFLETNPYKMVDPYY